MRKTEKMYALVSEWKSSGKTQKVFCQQHDLNLSTFAYWIAKKKQAVQPASGFWAVEAGGGADQPVTITYPNGVRLTTASSDARLISQLIQLW